MCIVGQLQNYLKLVLVKVAALKNATRYVGRPFSFSMAGEK
jgi:hypothetical protein